MRYETEIQAVRPWRELATTDPLVAGLVAINATNAEAADALAHHLASLREQLRRALEVQRIELVLPSGAVFTQK